MIPALIIETIHFQFEIQTLPLLAQRGNLNFKLKVITSHELSYLGHN